MFPQIKAFGCCHEVFGTQSLLGRVLREEAGVDGATREDIKVNVVGVNHFTWLTAAQYRDIDVYPLYRRFAQKYHAEGCAKKADDNWFNRLLCQPRDGQDGPVPPLWRDRRRRGPPPGRILPGSWYLKDPQPLKSGALR